MSQAPVGGGIGVGSPGPCLLSPAWPPPQAAQHAEAEERLPAQLHPLTGFLPHDAHSPALLQVGMVCCCHHGLAPAHPIQATGHPCQAGLRPWGSEAFKWEGTQEVSCRWSQELLHTAHASEGCWGKVGFGVLCGRLLLGEEQGAVD